MAEHAWLASLAPTGLSACQHAERRSAPRLFTPTQWNWKEPLGTRSEPHTLAAARGRLFARLVGIWEFASCRLIRRIKALAWALQRTVRRQAGRCITGASKRRLPRAKRGRATAVIHAVLLTFSPTLTGWSRRAPWMIDPTSGRAHQTLLAAHAAQSQNRSGLSVVGGSSAVGRPNVQERTLEEPRLVVCSGRLLGPLDQAATHGKPNLHQEARSI